MKRRLLAVSVAAAVTAAAGSSSAAPDRPLRVGLVTQAAGVKDPYLRISYAGLRRAVRELGVQGRVLTPGENEGYLPSFAYFARQRYDLVIGVGFLEVEDLDRAARRFPGTRFAISGVPWEALPHRPRNVLGLDFKSEEGAYLAGFLAALVERRGPGKDVVSAVGGLPVPSVERFIAGYRSGARRASPGISVLAGYAQDFQDTSKCAAAAANQIAQGSGVVFGVAGACTFGALAEAKRRGIFGIGVDIDMSFLGPHILTSVIKREDVGVFEAIRAVQRGTFRSGRTRWFGLRDGGVALGKISPRVPRAFSEQVEQIRRRIAAGEIRGIPTSLR